MSSTRPFFFQCSVCTISLPVIYQGRAPPFLPGVRYKEDVFIMEEQSNDSIPVAVGGICSECGKPCCLQPSCSVISSEDGKRYCTKHKH
ncbi:hypothetical protein WA577_005746 [Blastocystis sp. JDR]